jgi:hypothetical protein
MPQFFAAGGSLAYPFFLFAEELWVGAEAERVGVSVRYVPTLQVNHDEHKSIGLKRRGIVAEAKYEGLKYWSQRARILGW